MPDNNQILYAIEAHSVEGIKEYFVEGGNPNDTLPDGVPLFKMMVEMYTRTRRFKDCVKAFIDAGLKFEDKALLAVLTDDADELHGLLQIDATNISNVYSAYNNTYTPLTDGTLLHFCAEYNSVACAKVLVKYGADVNAKAGFGQQRLWWPHPHFSYSEPKRQQFC